MDVTTPFERLVWLIGHGSAAELTRRVNDALPEGERVSHQAVCKWKEQIPANRCRLLERLANGQVSCEQMRPDVFGEPAERQAA